MDKRIDIAVVGATGLIGGAVLELLAERDLPLGTLYPLASAESDGEIVEFGKRRLTVHALAAFDFSKVQIVIFCVPPEVSTEYIPLASQQGCWVIDHSWLLRERDDVPLVVASVNPEDIDLAREHKLLACPDSAVSILAPVIKLLNDKNQVERVNVVQMRAVSDIGKIGIDELSKQSIALFNLKPIVCQHFDQQIAFNVIAAQNAAGKAGRYDLESQTQTELRKIGHDRDLMVNTTITHVPVFYGHSLAVQLELQNDVDEQALKRMIKNSSDLRYELDKKAASVPTPVNEGSNQVGISFGRLTKDKTWDRGLNLWLVADNVRQGCAINSVQITEILVKDYL